MVREIEAYITLVSDSNTLEEIVVYGDGANWINIALDDAFSGMVKHVFDSYHWQKACGILSREFPRSKVPEKLLVSAQQ